MFCHGTYRMIAGWRVEISQKLYMRKVPILIFEVIFLCFFYHKFKQKPSSVDCIYECMVPQNYMFKLINASLDSAFVLFLVCLFFISHRMPKFDNYQLHKIMRFFREINIYAMIFESAIKWKIKKLSGMKLQTWTNLKTSKHDLS